MIPLLIFVTVFLFPYSFLKIVLGGISPYQFSVMILVLLFFIHCALDTKFTFRFHFFDFLFVIYLLLILANSIPNLNSMPIIKTFGYFLFYLVMKFLMQNQEISKVRTLIENASIYSSISLLVVFIYALTHVKYTEFNYFSLTVLVFDYLATFSGADSFASKDLMRNFFGEVFVFFFIVALFSNRKRIRVLSISTIFFILISFSRRSFLVFVTASFFHMVQRFGIRVSLFLAVIVIVVSSVFLSGLEYRAIDLNDSDRVSQYIEVSDYIDSFPISGSGFGAKLESGSYVHNAILANWYMNGMLGLLVSLAIFFYLFRCLILHIVDGDYYLGTLLLIPLVGMLVGSTVEGFFTPISWFVLAYYFNLKRGLPTELSKIKLRG